jgi:hypothetical protein
VIVVRVLPDPRWRGHGDALEPSLISARGHELRSPPDADDIADRVRLGLLDDDGGSVRKQRLQTVTLQTQAVDIREGVYIDQRADWGVGGGVWRAAAKTSAGGIQARVISAC